MKLKSFSSVVHKDRWAKGSKSDHFAVFVVIDGQPFKLRREGGNPFVDPQLEALVGKRIDGKGREIAGSTFLLSGWEIVEDSEDDRIGPPRES